MKPIGYSKKQISNRMYSYVICGQVFSRLGERSVSYFEDLKNADNSREIVVSTWKGEVPKSAYRFIDSLVESEDPGICEYGVNWKRILVSTKCGLEAASSEMVVRSRVEVNVIDSKKLQHTVSETKISGKFVAFPLGVSLYLFSKGLLLCPPDFLQIGLKKNLVTYWDLEPEPNPFQPFCMTTGANDSLCSDQVLGANFAFKFSSAEHFGCSRYIFSNQNWNAQKRQWAEFFGFFEEAKAGLDLGRLARQQKLRSCQIKRISGNNFEIKLSKLGLPEFLIYYVWDFQNRKVFNIRRFLGKLRAALQSKAT